MAWASSYQDRPAGRAGAEVPLRNCRCRAPAVRRQAYTEFRFFYREAIMQTTWIISANAGRARFFSQSDPAQPLQEIEDMVNAAVRLPAADTQTDKLSPTAAGSSSHAIGGAEAAGFAHNAKAGAPNKAYQPADTPSDHVSQQFARDISAYLLQAHQEGRFKHLAIFASPHFLGVLRALLAPQLLSLVTFEADKDYTNANPQQLREHLQARPAG
jgi:protein required for attachment to host cells